MSHGADFEINRLSIAGKAKEWKVTCRCGDTDGVSFFGPTYEAVEDSWRQHVHQATGQAPEPMGDQTERWQP